MVEKAGVVARPRASRIDERRAAAARKAERIDAERSAAPIDMRMKIDQARRDDQSGHVLDIIAAELGADLRDAPVAETDIRDRIDPLRRIDDPPAPQHQIKRHLAASRTDVGAHCLCSAYLIVAETLILDGLWGRMGCGKQEWLDASSHWRFCNPASIAGARPHPIRPPTAPSPAKLGKGNAPNRFSSRIKAGRYHAAQAPRLAAHRARPSG